jgi:hypothetical protein
VNLSWTGDVLSRQVTAWPIRFRCDRGARDPGVGHSSIAGRARGGGELGWTLLAINAQLLGSGLEAEARQWSWLEEQASERSENQRIALITHKPVVSTDAEMASSPPYRFLPSPGRDRLADLVKAALVISGHVHQYRLLHLNGTDHLWAPTTWAVLPDEVQPIMGAKRCGIVSLEFAVGTPLQPEFIEPEGLAQLTLISDLPDPYHR